MPATEAELTGDIDQFVLGREPKFEFVYADGPDQPAVINLRIKRRAPDLPYNNCHLL